MRTNPHVLEVNAKIWFHQMKRDFGRNITLSDIPESYIVKLKAAGFDALWLMGVWEESLTSRQIARSDGPINNYLKRIVPDYTTEDIFGSPYSICSYNVDKYLGTNEDLLKFKAKLNENGMALILRISKKIKSAKANFILAQKERLELSRRLPTLRP